MTLSNVVLTGPLPGQSLPTSVVIKSGQGTSKRRAILVLGMHRSGTSALTRILGLCGATLPMRIAPPGSDNETGFWEPREITAIQEEILQSAGSSWHDVSEFSRFWFNSDVAESFKRRLITAVHEDFLEAPLFVIKDPRACRLVPLWLSVLEEIGVEPLFTIPVRNPLEVAASIKKRNGFSEAKSLLLWLRHFLTAERDTRGLARSFISYEGLLKNWRGVLDKVGRDLGVDWPRQSHAAELEIEDFLSATLRHHTFEYEEVYARRNVVQWVQTAFRWAEQAAHGRPTKPDELDSVYEALETADRGFMPLLAAAEASLSILSHDVTRLSEADAARESELQHLRAEASARERKIARLETEIASRNSEAGRLQCTLEHLRAEITARDGKIARLEMEITSRNSEDLAFRSRKDREFIAFQARMKRVEAERDLFRRERDGLVSSTSWRITAPVRRFAASSPFGVRLYARRTLKLLYWLATPHRTRQRVAFLKERRKTSPVFRDFFDPDWYKSYYPDVAASGLAPLKHFLKFGLKECRNPNRAFDTSWYLASYPDVAESGVIPIDHFVRCGAEEGRQPFAAGFDPAFYRMQAGIPHASNLEAYRHYLKSEGKAELYTSVESIPANAASPVLGEDGTSGAHRVCIGIVAYRTTAAQMRRIVTSTQRAIARCGDRIAAEIRVLDNGGTLHASELPPDVVLISPAENEGFGKGHNRCMKDAFDKGADTYIAANPDGAFHPDCIRQMMAMHETQQGRALIEAQQFPNEHPKYYDPVSLSTPWVSGACMLIPRSLWKQTGGFDPAFFLYCEDVDLSWTARRLGFRTLMCPSALFFHDVSGREHENWRSCEMLAAGRYLAYKWGNDSFQKWAEQQLLEGGFAFSPDELPPLDDLPTIPGGAAEIADFGFLFHFAPARW